MANGSGAPLICFSGHDWWYHNRAHSDIQLMTRIAKDRKVLFVNSIGMRMPMPGRSTKPFRRILRKALSMLRYMRRPLPETPDFVVMTPIMIPVFDLPWIRRWNFRLISWQVLCAAWFLGIHRPHVFITVPTGIEVCRNWERMSLAYNRSDIHSAFPEVDKAYIESLEDELLHSADIVFYSSRSLLGAELGKIGDRAHFLDHGLDLEHFTVPRTSEAARATRKPVIGFFGGLDDYIIDFDLLEKLAVAYPNATLRLIGDATLSLERLKKYDNVELPGYLSYDQIPKEGAQFDVAIMPWLKNDWIEHCNPIKMKEYLALGLEIVTIEFPEAEYYREHIHIAKDHAEFLRIVGEILKGNCRKVDEAVRKALLSRSTWEERSQECITALDGVGEKKCAE